ncbi:glycosyltransferase family 2 protein [Fibrivirga algicola]|uniref:Glycosyltransferase family 2 protein n=1 Tax=Fibrivirga algicola TaxID=2950420 RepID=A0ABX0Q9G4_9BACT|nr:glycosyltransferase family 2 protein [Fibrivirga algicola]ARK09104.1 glycosyl transferase [Fibrella sp. ES10-3-2-2]NID08786.1 glycosyltransferase family 2 protein [Fibrivirga algicola]
MSGLSVIILTHNEEKHIARCLASLQPITSQVFIVDSYSTDRTVEIARSMGAVVVQNPWSTYAVQFNYGITHTPFRTDWLMRMDADEYILPELATEINERLATVPADVSGIYVKRRVMFMNQWIRHGGYYPIWLLRLWRQGQGICEQTWMDEHIKLDKQPSGPAKTIQFNHDLVDHNLNNLTWWTQKHNNYATREVIDLLNIRYNFDDTARVAPRLFGAQEERKRYLKEKYATLPLFTRPIIYFLFRYVVQLGFLDGRKGFVWHFLQGLWYRFLVDAKLMEVYNRAGHDKGAIIAYFKDEYGRDLTTGVR